MTTTRPTIERAGITYAQVADAPAYHIQSQGPGYLSHGHHTADASEVAPLATRCLAAAADLLCVTDGAWMAQDGSCRSLTVSCYRKRDGKWEHLSGRRITLVDELIASGSRWV